MKIRKAFQGTIPDNKILDAYSTSQTDTYSCNYVNSVIANGSNSNGSYVKYADGTMICYGERSGTASWSDYWGLCKRTPDSSSSALSVTFPQTFTATPTIQLTGDHTGYVFAANVFSVSTTTLKVMLFKPTNATGTDYKYSWLAIGKWK